MDFQLAEDQVTVNDLARDIFSRNGDPQRLFDIEAGQDRFDRVLHRDLADSGVLGLLVPEEHGGAGLGLWEVAGVFVEQGRTLGTVPLWETLVGGVLPLVRYGDARQQAEWLPRVAAGDAVLTVAVDDLADARPYGARVRARSGAEPGGAGVTLSGTAVGVRSAHLADAIIVPATDEEGTVGLYLVPTAGPGVRRDTFERTDRGLASDVHLEGAAAELLAEGPEEDRIDWLLRQVWIAVAALQSGISQAAVRQAADYTSGREQFGVPIATFQAVAHQIANCHIDTEAMEVTYLNALWRETTARPPRAAVHVAKYWAAEAGDRVARTVQHVHGGMGADVTYPIHRYMLWTTQLANTAGSGAWQLQQLADLVDAGEQL
ncbi:acyl-CoA/acyl-ACP dehydrogenase [Micromonospora peucetia]|uniref:Acyl-CoA/acyl-ACP dehydrogenase n=1 Tax=Micromonospora peucetia TaxID=47871 RepID=A0ABZ1E8M5_9ACTN|nr:acyl-CoA dehydrogenase family protein [Micromonospora peucetia]MCX4388158.1 acyl-CoA/acyl-ACP dehydrogenase [Micromonospora peucetia]WSA31163.1 acyl-CoA/acyl-ACP dehydrogenase [Micromonospora peucetia]